MARTRVLKVKSPKPGLGRERNAPMFLGSGPAQLASHPAPGRSSYAAPLFGKAIMAFPFTVLASAGEESHRGWGDTVVSRCYDQPPSILRYNGRWTRCLSAPPPTGWKAYAQGAYLRRLRITTAPFRWCLPGLHFPPSCVHLSASAAADTGWTRRVLAASSGLLATQPAIVFLCGSRAWRSFCRRQNLGRAGKCSSDRGNPAVVRSIRTAGR